MGTDRGTMSNMRRLANAQATDAAWLSAVATQCGMDMTILTIDYWNKTFDLKEMGNVEFLQLPDLEGIKWVRPDGGMPLLVTDQVPEYITLARFLLFAGVIKGIQSNGELSYVKVGGPPMNWNHAKVYFNGREMEKVIAADAVLNTIEFYKSDKSGKTITNEEKGTVETIKIAGIVRIVPASAPLTFF